jgi:UDP-glucose:(heptosyl)LPS alpha-1,3-glucosyltransferase
MFRHPALKTVICNSQMVANEIRELFGLSDDQLTVIYNGVDSQAFHPGLASQRDAVRTHWRIPTQAPLLVYVGSGFERKGVATALAAIAPLAGLHLLVVGHDKHAARYQAQARALGIAERVIFTGAQKEVKSFYAAADALILPTLYDPFPNVCVEALACGLPLFTSTGCGAAEWIQPGKNGWVRDALDVAGFTADLSHWLQREADWPALRACARVTAEPYTLEAMAEELLALYRRLLGAR